MRWDLFAPSKRKMNLIETLVHRAIVICSPGKVKQEMDCIRSILKNNGYSETIINSNISKKISRFQLLPKEGPKKCPAYLKLPWIGNISRKFEKQVKSNVQNCFRAIDSRVIFQTRKICLQSIRMLCPSLIKVWSYISTCAAVIAGTWIAHPYDCKIESINTFQNQFELKKIQTKFFPNVTAKLLLH